MAEWLDGVVGSGGEQEDRREGGRWTGRWEGVTVCKRVHGEVRRRAGRWEVRKSGS